MGSFFTRQKSIARTNSFALAFRLSQMSGFRAKKLKTGSFAPHNATQNMRKIKKQMIKNVEKRDNKNLINKWKTL
ncbi:hypothetical protein CQA40_00410 [Helicobacter sp. MIT 01-3238]|nr:hypothetical protein CQA40_00410 [Helicobacter sp. MIT 01-3238]